MITSLIIGALVGWIASILMDSQGGFLRNILLGVVGSAVGRGIAAALGLAATGIFGSIVIGIVGSCIVILVCRKLF